jgi:hypothetical protein
MFDGKPSRMVRPQYVMGSDAELAVRGKPPMVSEFRPEDPANVPHHEQAPIEFPKGQSVTAAPITGRSIQQQALTKSDEKMLPYVAPKSHAPAKVIEPVIGQ